MKVLVVGGAGYIGSHCCKALSQAGHEPIVFDNLSTGRREFVRWGEFYQGDILDKAALDEVMAKHAPDVVMHFAALAIVPESVAEPQDYYTNNVTGTLNVLQAMRKFGLDSIVFSSTCAVYGEPATMPIDEKIECRPVNPYGTTKLICERMMDDFDDAYGLKSFRLRYFNAAGADPDAEIGEDRDAETHLIPLVLDALGGRRDGISIFGDDYPTPDGTAVRDYIHVTDIANAHIMALEYLLEHRQTAAVNLGTGQGTSVSEVMAAAEQRTGIGLTKTVKPRRPGDPPTLVADPGKANTLLRWKAQSSDISTIVDDAWRWHQRRFQDSQLQETICSDGDKLASESQ
ncbi:MAG: UDP-glucose 4-epimerase GalE [Hyphomicrobiales bacterium]|nr:UDP-glucose 4-epimerase GalE [Hyphomicrobiales bacterium]